MDLEAATFEEVLRVGIKGKGEKNKEIRNKEIKKGGRGRAGIWVRARKLNGDAITC